MRQLCVASVSLSKNNENKWPELEDIDASSFLTLFQLIYTMLWSNKGDGLDKPPVFHSLL